MLENHICQQFHTRTSHTLIDPGDESLCKGKEIQKQLATVTGVLLALNAVPSLFQPVSMSEREADKLVLQHCSFLPSLDIMLIDMDGESSFFWPS